MRVRVSDGPRGRGKGAEGALVGKVLAATRKGAGTTTSEVSRGGSSLGERQARETHKVMLLRVHSKMALALPVATMPPAADELKKLIWSAWSGT